jgi:hypothetical protein
MVAQEEPGNLLLASLADPWGGGAGLSACPLSRLPPALVLSDDLNLDKHNKKMPMMSTTRKTQMKMTRLC